MKPAGIYIHIPFCQAKCAYCDFVSFAGLEHLHAPYIQALLREIELKSPAWAGIPFDTLYLGGGTPSILSPAQIGHLLEACRHHFQVLPESEITLEANPGTVQNWLPWRKLGITRLSLGIQSLHDDELALLGRIHDAQEAIQAYTAARAAGFENINLDFLFGLPGQSLRRWQETLTQALELAPEHLSLYCLTLEEHTPLARQIAQGLLPAPDDDLAAEMYELAEEMLAKAGYLHYEISNWARSTGESEGELPRLACRHNVKYWHNERYLGLGAAAYSYDGKRRSGNVEHPKNYILRLQRGQDPTATSEETDRQRQIEETMMLGLRLLEGISWEAFSQRFGEDLREIYAQEITTLAEEGLLTIDERGIRLSKRGRLLGNRVFAAFLH